MKVIKKNKRAQFDYFLLKTYSAGVILLGPEVKEVKSGHIDLTESFVKFKNDELYLWNALVSSSKYPEIDSDREKKLLLHGREIIEIKKQLTQKGYTMIPTAIGLERGLIKVDIAIAKGKKKYDKRESIKKRDAERMMRAITYRER